MKTQAYGYLRVSGKGQVKKTGFARQEEVIRAYAKKNKTEMAGIFKEKEVSGTKGGTDRPAFQEMMANILGDNVNTIIVEGMDRLAREVNVQDHLLIYLASKDITLISATTGEDVTQATKDNPMKKALLQIQGVFSELEKNLLVKRLKVGRDKVKAERGKCEGRKSLKESKPEVIKEIRHLRRKPKGMKRMTFKTVAEELNRKGHTTVLGKSFTANNVQVIEHRLKHNLM